jgi:hypothetical protein
VLGKLNEALEHQQESMRAQLAQLEAQLAQLEAQLPTDESGRRDWSWWHGRDYLPESPLGRQVRKLWQLLETPLRLSPEPVTCSAKTQLNIEDLRGHIKDELFDPSGFPEFGREQPSPTTAFSASSRSSRSHPWTAVGHVQCASAFCGRGACGQSRWHSGPDGGGQAPRRQLPH